MPTPFPLPPTTPLVTHLRVIALHLAESSQSGDFEGEEIVKLAQVYFAFMSEGKTP